MKNPDTSPKTKAAVFGAGAWGTALATQLVRCQHAVTLWGRDTQQIADMRKTQTNTKYLPDLELPEQLNFADTLGDWLTDCQHLVIAVPSQAVPELLQDLKPFLSQHPSVIIASKGAHRTTDQIEFLTQTSARILGPKAQYAVLSGPSFAHELVQGIPTAVMLAAHDEALAQRLAGVFHSPNFRVYASTDPVGVQLASIGKNVIAVAAGAVDGMQLGDNTRAALICRGLNELVKLGQAMTLDTASFTGLAGIGDIILTCTCDASRNRRFGKAIGAGMTSAQAAQSVGKLVEARANAELLLQLASEHGVSMPITEQVCAVLGDEVNVRDAMANLLARPLPNA